MQLQEIYELGLTMAIKADPRGEETAKKVLAKTKKAYKELSDKKKKYFDLESLTNPYSDSRLLIGNPKREVKKVLAGIDVDSAEIVLADLLNQKGMGIDAVISHHPDGHALAGLHEVMDIQIEPWAATGIPINVVDALMQERSAIVKRRFGPINHTQTIDAARLLDVPLIAMHTFWDNLTDQFTRNYIKGKNFDTVGDLYDYLCEIPEYNLGLKGKAGPSIVSGSESSRAGKVTFGCMTGGTNPSKEIYIEMAKAGAGTIIEMHISEDVVLELRKLHVHAIDLGHMAADSIGANLFLDALEKKGVEVVPFGGLVRVKRNK